MNYGRLDSLEVWDMKYYKTTEKIYDFCKSYIDEHGYAPTIREIGSYGIIF